MRDGKRPPQVIQWLTTITLQLNSPVFHLTPKPIPEKAKAMVSETDLNRADDPPLDEGRPSNNNRPLGAMALDLGRWRARNIIVSYLFFWIESQTIARPKHMRMPIRAASQ
jgi:hypothetical protein